MATVMLAALVVAGPTLQAQMPKVKDAAPRDYRFVCEYMTLTPKGEVSLRRKYAATYQSDQPKGRLRWTDGSVATATGAQGPYGEPKKLDAIDGFSYGWADVGKVGTPEFFKSIPAIQVESRNLVWDTHMFENFAHNHLDRLRLNEPVVVSENRDNPLAESGSFYDRSIDLTWIGDGRWNGVSCALLRYRAFLNRFTYNLGGLETQGSSDYWGEIWLAKKTNRIEYATLYESVAVRMGSSNQSMRVFRIGTLEHTPLKK